MGLSKETIRAMEDVRVLLEFLGRRADSVLLSQFEDTRASATPIRQLAIPPCNNYQRFVNRLAEIGQKIDDRSDLSPASGSKGEPSDIAFLYLSRDFLAALCAPASADSIRTTAAYIEARGQPFLLRAKLGLRVENQDEYSGRGRRLAGTAKHIEWFTLAMTLLTMALSVYALSGRMILDKQRQIYAEYAEIGRERGELAQELVATSTEQIDPNDLFIPPPGCDSANPKLNPKPGALLKEVNSHQVPVGTGPPPSRSSPAALLASRKCALYWKTRQATQDIAAVTLHLMSWTQVVIGASLPQGISYAYDHIFSPFFGINPAFIRKAAERHAELCARIGAEFQTSSEICARQLADMIYRDPEVAESLLGAITLYLLPGLYGYLGAAGATLRDLRRKVDRSLATITDRGRVREGVILGLLCGAVIGLFAGYINNATPTTGLGLSALALLAGFNVPLVFSFFDALSNRLFRPASSASPNRQA